MNKEQLLHAVRDGLQRGIISRNDLQNLSLTGGSPNAAGMQTASQNADSRNTLVSKVLYALGGIIALIGIVVLIGSNWDDLGTAGRLVITLGFSLVTYGAALYMYKKGIQDALVQIFFVLSAAVSPIASFVLLDSLGIAVPSEVSHQVAIAIALVLIFAAALYATKKSILHIVVGLLFSWGYFAAVAWLLKGSGIYPDAFRDITIYSSMILGFGFLAYNSWLKGLLKTNHSAGLRRVASLYNAFAFLLVLMPTLVLGGIWNLLYAFLALGAVVLSVNLRTTTGLVISALAIGIYVIHISSIYFADNVGWALTLVLIGFVIIGLGYLTYYLNRKYISKTV